MKGDNKGALIYTIDKSSFEYAYKKRYFPILSIALVVLVIIGFYEVVSLFISKRYRASFVFFILTLIMYAILRYFAIPFSIIRPFQIYEKGIVPAERSLKEWITRKDTFIPFEEIEKVEVVYREKYRDRDPSELRLDPEYVEYVKLTLKDGTTRIISHFWYGIDEECMKELLKVLKKKQLIEGINVDIQKGENMKTNWITFVGGLIVQSFVVVMIGLILVKLINFFNIISLVLSIIVIVEGALVWIAVAKSILKSI